MVASSCARGYEKFPSEPALGEPHSPSQYASPATGNCVGMANHSGLPNAPTAFPLQSLPVGPWSTGLFDCFKDLKICCFTCCCPCVTFGQVAEIVDRGTITCAMSGCFFALLRLTLCTCIFSSFYRTKMRHQYGLEATPCNDCIVHCLCEECALCQMERELKHRGLNVALGWQGNAHMVGPVFATMPPGVQAGMIP